MIHVLVGENSIEVDAQLKRLVTGFAGTPELLDADTLTIQDIPDITAGQTLFSASRLVIIRQLSTNKPVWDELVEWLEKLAPETTLVLIEQKPDARSKTYKWLKKNADIIECHNWKEQETGLAVEWAIVTAKRRGFTLTTALARRLVERTGAHQGRIIGSLDKLALAEVVNEQTIDTLADQHPSEKSFGLFEAALSADTDRVRTMISELEKTDDPYMVVGLLASQATQLAALVFGRKTPTIVANDLKTNQFMVSKLAVHATHRSAEEVKDILTKLAQLDTNMKTTSVDSWLLIERFLLEVAISSR